jgi:cobalt-zinc-cadmium efflux system membrane fusion protein
MASIFLVSLRLVAVLLAVFIAPIGLAQDNANEAGDAPTVVALTDQQRQQNGVVLAMVEKRSLSERLTAPGEIVFNAYQSSKVTPRIASHSLARHALLGEKVTKGQPLARLSSVEMAKAQGDLMIAANEWERVKKIGKETVSERRYTEAQVSMQQAMAKVQAYGMTQAQVREFLSNKDVSQATGAYDVVSPQNGTVVSDNFVIGERIEPGQVLFELTDESSVWIDARVAARDARDLSETDVVRISVDGIRWTDGEIVQLTHKLDEQTRTRIIRVEMSNQDDRLHPGEFVQVEILLGNDEVLTVPASSIVTLKELPTVFRRTAKDEFSAVVVETGVTEDGWIEIHSGLSEGDEVAIEGVFGLKAELLNLQGGE